MESSQNWSTNDCISSREAEHRFTMLESKVAHLDDHRMESKEASARHSDRLSRAERAILVLAILVYILLQDQFPKLATVLKGFP